ncbi:MAG: MFS transporter [Planctomycetota bacterium]|nr:MAG: MFS transporter [Planctomycetota bacterium]
MIEIRRDERRTVVIAIVYFALVMAGWFMLRPLREDSGSSIPAGERATLYTWTFVCSLPAVPLYSWLVSVFERRKLLVALYAFFCVNLAAFWWCQSQGWFTGTLDRVFYVWASVYNLLIVSIFWSVVVDVFDSGQGKRLFGIVAAGGSIGALVGSQVTKSYFEHLARSGLYLIAMGGLVACAACAIALLRTATVHDARTPRDARGTGGSWLGGFTLVLGRPYLLALAAQTLCITFGSTILYNEKLELVAAVYPRREDRPEVFATIDQYTNVATLIGQSLITAWMLRRFGLRVALGFLPVLGLLGFAALAWLLGASSIQHALYLVVGFEVLRKAAHHVFEKPAREVLFTVVSREEKYKAKEFLDVSVYRGGDCLAGWVYPALQSAGRTLPAWSAVPLSALAFLVTGFLAREQRRLAEPKAAAGTDVASSG